MKGHATVTLESILYKCGWSPFEGVTFSATIDMTLVNGVEVWDGQRVCATPQGQRLQFPR